VGLSVVGKVIWHLPDGGRVVGLMGGQGSTDIRDSLCRNPYFWNRIQCQDF